MLFDAFCNSKRLRKFVSSAAISNRGMDFSRSNRPVHWEPTDAIDNAASSDQESARFHLVANQDIL